MDTGSSWRALALQKKVCTEHACAFQGFSVHGGNTHYDHWLNSRGREVCHCMQLGEGTPASVFTESTPVQLLQ